MEKVNTTPIFSLRIASRLMEEGYVIDHVDRNKNCKYLRVFYFRDTPGLKDDIERIKQELNRVKKDVPTIAVNKIGLAQRLLVRGYQIHHLGKNRDDHKQAVFYFVDIPGLQEAIDEYLGEVAHARW